jgi:hypothetical protein
LIDGWRAAREDERQLAWVGFAAAVLSLALSPFAAVAARLVPSCHLRAWTGLPCPTCGSTRAVLAMAHFEWLEAIRVNPLATLGVAGALAAGLAAPLWIRAGGKLPVLTRRGRRWVLWTLVAAVAANWVYLVGSSR